MSEQHDRIAQVSSQADVIDERIGQTFAFLRDAIDDPSLLEAIPSGATLRFRDVMIDRHVYRLTAYRTPRMRRWAARVTGPPSEIAAHSRQVGTNAPTVRGETAEDALNGLEAKLRNSAARVILVS